MIASLGKGMYIVRCLFVENRDQILNGVNISLMANL